MEITLAELTHVCGLRNVAQLAARLPHMNAALIEAQVTTPLRAAMWLAQVTHECADLTRFEENLNYSADALQATFRHHFQTPEIAAAYAHQPERIANRAYCLRLGNGDEASGDGWRYRGRGAIQLTGFENYHRLAIETGIDFVSHPLLLALPEYAFVAAAHFWRWHGLNVYADRDDVVGATKAVQGADGGLADRDARYRAATEILLPQNA